MSPLIKNKLLDPILAARYLLGGLIVRTLPDGKVLRGRIVETEAYHEADPASHSFGGKRVRNAALFGPPGRAYVYFTYGLHWCFNVTAGPEGYGAGVLIRAAKPISGINTMRELRKNVPDFQLTNGPAKLAQAFAINKTHYGHDLAEPPLQVLEGERVPQKQVVTSRRIGISRATHELMRFYIKDNPFVSR